MVLIRRLDGYICNLKHKAVGGPYKGQGRCDYVKVWPLRLCQLLVAGIQELKSLPKYLYEASSRWEPVSKQVSVSMQALHSTGNKPLPTLSARRLRTHSGGILLVQQLSEKATIPTRGSEDAAGLDLCAALPTEIAPQSRGLVSTGLAMAILREPMGELHHDLA